MAIFTPFFNISTVFRTLPALALGSVFSISLLLSGCHQTPSTSGTDEPAGDSLVMTTMALQALNQSFFTPLIDSDSLSDEQKSCLQARDKDLGRAELERFYTEQFSAEELQALEDFYSSTLGKKMRAYGDEQVRIINGEKISSPIAPPSAEEQVKIRAFMQSPLAKKYIKATSSEGKGSTMGALIYPMNSEFKRCNIDLDMSEFI